MAGCVMNKKFLYSITSLLLFSFLTACGVKIQGIDLGRVFNAAGKVGDLGEKSEEEEATLGKNTIHALLVNASINTKQQLQRYVNKVGYWLVRHTSRPDLAWQFIVLDDSAVNAFAAPGGYIVITTGMLASLNNEAELAGVLAHEIAHVILRHHLNALQTKSQTGFLLDLAILGTQVGNASTANEQGDLKGPDVSGMFDKAVADLYYRGLDREDEFKADRLGVLLSAKAGYDPYAFVSVLQVIGSREDRNEQDLQRFIRVHPSASTRLNSLESALFLVDSYDLSNRILAQRFRNRVVN